MSKKVCDDSDYFKKRDKITKESKEQLDEIIKESKKIVKEEK